VVVATQLLLPEQRMLGEQCHSRGIPFYYADTFGYTAYFFADANGHHFVEHVLPLAESSVQSAFLILYTSAL
jgi:hypothetical protein